VVQWNGSNRLTTFVSPSQLNASILTSDLAAPSVVNISVVNYGTLVSNNVAFTVTEPPVNTNISIQDAKLVEPSTGSVNMIFTVTLSAPAPSSGVSVNFATVQESAGASHAIAGSDYTTTLGTLNFASGEELKTILVPVLPDAINTEQDESFLVVLSSPTNGTITDDTGVGTITTLNSAGTLLISELRTSGPEGDGDDFVEIYNNSDTPHTVTSSDGSQGYGIFKMGTDCSAAPILIGIIPNATLIPARGHYLLVGSAYSLAIYATGDRTMLVDIEDNRNVSLFSTSDILKLSTTTRLDAVDLDPTQGHSVTCNARAILFPR
jgi:hypothetical protein